MNPTWNLYFLNCRERKAHAAYEMMWFHSRLWLRLCPGLSCTKGFNGWGRHFSGLILHEHACASVVAISGVSLTVTPGIIAIACACEMALLAS
jgi:hypothetical protein